MKKEVIINLSKIVKDYDNENIDLNYIFKDVMYNNGATKKSEGRHRFNRIIIQYK